MQPTNIAIAVLSALDISILILAPLLDKRLYRNYPKAPTAKQFFNNYGYEGQFNRFIYSSGGALLLSAVFLAIAVLSKHYGQDANG